MSIAQVCRAFIYRLLLATRPAASPHAPRHACAIFKFDRIGDFVLALGAIRLLLREFGEERCALIVSTLVEAWARELFPRATIIAFPLVRPGLLRGSLPFFLRHRARLAAVACDRLVCLRHQRTPEYEIMLASVDAREVFALESAGAPLPVSGPPRPGQTAPYPTAAPPGLCLELEAHRLLLELCLQRPLAAREMLPTLDAAASDAGDALVLCPFSSSTTKDYPDAGWSMVFRALPWRGSVRLCGVPSDRARLEELAAQLASLGWDARVEEAGSLSALVALLARARAVLGVDSAPAHLATALDRPGVFLLGGGHWGMFGPWQRSPRQIWLTHRLPCFHCAWDCTLPAPRCVADIPPTEIVAALTELLLPPRLP